MKRFIKKHARAIVISVFIVTLIVTLIYTLIYTLKPSVQIVVSRYNEDLSWLRVPPFNKYKSIVYNKGVNDDFEKHNVQQIINVHNVGRCDHTYLYHIIRNYSNLAHLTLFLPGSMDIQEKFKQGADIISEMEKSWNTVVIASRHENVKDDMYNFKIDTWTASSKDNSAINPESKLDTAPIRPFGKWYEDKFGGTVTKHVSWRGIMCIAKPHIIQHSKSHYLNIIRDVDHSSNPEAGHYIERSWEAIFYPIDSATIL